MSELKYCSQCESKHTDEFGDMFHNRLLKPRPIHIDGFDPGQAVQVGDVVTLEGVHKRAPWWKFWDRRKPRVLKRFIVMSGGAPHELG